MEVIDLHLHTNLSDGLLSPDRVVELAKQKQCKLISITDHEIITDFSDLEEKYNIEIINGIEFNSSVSNMHLLGYCIQDLDTIKTCMDNLRKENENVVLKVIDMLNRAGYNVTESKVVDYLCGIGLNADILDKRKLVKYLIYMGYADSVIDCYNKLIGKNQEFYVPNRKMTPFEIINLVNLCGGFVSIAHPETLQISKIELEKELLKLIKMGLCGIETFNKKKDFNNSVFYYSLAKQYNLIPTCGSDFHSYDTDEIGVEIDSKLYDLLKEKVIKY